MSANVVQSALRSLLGDLQPRSVMLLGDLPEINWRASLPAGLEPVFTELSPDQLGALPACGVQDLTAVGNVLEVLPKRDGAALLAALRDLHARRVLLRLTSTPGWSHHDAMAFGFSHLARLTYPDHTVHYYGFDLSTYKITPDWLNARYWANPELFGRYRW
ncbi:MAG: DUF6231 family protein [Aquisalimonadaceae bacterium]